MGDRGDRLIGRVSVRSWRGARPLVLVLVLTAIGGVVPSAAAAGTFAAIKLPTSNGTHWNSVNDSNQVAGSYIPVGERPVPEIWSNGGVTPLSIPSAAICATAINGYADAIDAQGAVFGGEECADSMDYSRGYPVYWSPTAHTATVPFTGSYNGVAELTAASRNGNTAGIWCGNDGSYTPCQYVAAPFPTGGTSAYQFATVPVTLTDPGGVVDGISINDSGEIAVGGSMIGQPSYLFPSGVNGTRETPSIVLAGTPRDLNDKGDVIGTSGGAPAIELANGTVQMLPLLHSGDTATPTAINDSDEVVGSDCQASGCVAVVWIGGHVTTAASMVSGTFTGTLAAPVDVNNEGSILVQDQQNGASGDYLLEPTAHFSASIALTGANGQPLTAGSTAVGQKLVAKVTLTDPSSTDSITGITVSPPLKVSPAAALSQGTGPTPAPPTTLAPGKSASYSMTYTIKSAGRVTLSMHASGSQGGATATADASTVTQVGQPLQVRVTLSRQSLRLVLAKDGKLESQRVNATATIKNTGQQTVSAVTAQKPLYSAVGGAKVAQIPLKLLTGPSPSSGRDLKPGQSVEVKYEIEVSGDGTYDVEVLAIGGQAGGGRVSAVGSARLTVGSPLLVLSSEMGREVKSPNAPQLIRAGTVFTVKLKVENLSYTQKLGIYPMVPELEGNASDGHVETAGLPIQNPSLTTPPQPSEAFELVPRQSRELEIIVRTTATYADVQSPEFPGGGTRAVVHVPNPDAVVLDDAGSITNSVAGRDISVLGDREYRVGIDDRDFRDPPPEANFPAKVAYFGVGVFHGIWNLTAGAVSGVFKDLPLLLAKGIIGVPSAIVSYADLEAQLWDSIKDDPAQRALFLNGVGNLALLAYKNAPALAGNIADFYKRVDQQVLAHYTQLANDESSGRYYAAVEEEAKGWTEVGGNLVLASGLLTRLPAAAEALNTIKQASYVRVGETLNAIADGVGARGALAALADAVPGYEFLTTDLRKFYGLSENQVAYLRGFAERNRLIITLRSRAAESLKWLNDGAVLKPEQIKIKTVSIDDINYLGYRDGDLGRVVIREPPTEAELAREMRAKGFGPDDPQWATAFKRRLDRSHEFNHPAYDQGYVKYLEDGASNGELNLRWNLQQNSVDPSVLPNGYTKYGVRLLDEGGGNRVLQFCVDTPPCSATSSGWRSVTGDVDFLSIVHADGSPLSVFERISVYRQMAKSPVGMLHPAADTWTLVKRFGEQVFDFPVKVNEFVRGGTVAQFGPDGIARAVTFNADLSKFTNAETYRIFWNGGYQNVKRKLFGG